MRIFSSAPQDARLLMTGCRHRGRSARGRAAALAGGRVGGRVAGRDQVDAQPAGQRAAVQVDAYLVAVGVTDPEGLRAQPSGHLLPGVGGVLRLERGPGAPALAAVRAYQRP